MIAANIRTESKIVVMYKLIPVGYVDNLDDLPFQFFNSTGTVSYTHLRAHET